MKDLSLHILDIVQNSLRAGADHISIHIRVDEGKDSYSLEIEDNGSGMDPITLEKAMDPFFTSRTTRKVGLGIPLLKQNTERTEGKFEISSEKGVGTKVISKSKLSHIDLLPEGDLAGVITLLISANPEKDFSFSYSTKHGSYEMSTKTIKEILGDIPINEPDVRRFLKEMLFENLQPLINRNIISEKI
ncbi:MAG: ATP-binding protein [Bacteroidales bacterium]|nr:ATP-binding protein [Bacteroidales bacterium]